MQFGHTLRHVLEQIVYANPWFGPVKLIKIDFVDGYYWVPLSSCGALQLAVVLPANFQDPLIAITIVGLFLLVNMLVVTTHHLPRDIMHQRPVEKLPSLQIALQRKEQVFLVYIQKRFHKERWRDNAGNKTLPLCNGPWFDFSCAPDIRSNQE